MLLIKQNKQIMGRKFKTNHILPTALILSCALLGSCEKNSFDPEKVKATYEDKFPVKDIDPNMNWKMTNLISVNISVYEDTGVDYSIRIYDADPLEVNSSAKVLAKGTANDKLPFTTQMDCPTALTEVYVCRTDAANRNVVKVATISNGTLNVTFGTSPTTRTFTRAVNNSITTYEPERSESEVQALIPQAAVITVDDANKWEFFQSGKAYIIPEATTYKGPINKHLNDGKPATIIIAGKWIPTNMDIEKGYDVCVMNGGEISIPDNQTLSIKNNSRLFIYKGGKVSGEKIDLTNGSAGQYNYNAGTIELENLNISTPGCTFYNCGTVKVDKLNINNRGTKFVNQGKTEIEETYTQTTIENGCFLTVEKFTGLSLVLGDNCYTKIEEFNPQWDTEVSLGANTILTIEEGKFGKTRFKGTAKPSLVKIEEIKEVNQMTSEGAVYYEIKEHEGDKYKQFVKCLTNTGSTISKWGESPVVIPEGDCTGEGNNPGEGSETPSGPIPYTYVFEDNFPLVGDYDFNDVVLDVSINHDRSSDNKITTTNIDITLAAAGATKTIGAGLRLVNVDRAAIANISYEGDVNRFQNTLSGSVLANVNFEDGMVIPLFGNVHSVFGVTPGTMINTGIATAPTYTYKIKIEQSNAYQRESPVISKDNLDFFIAYKFRSMQQRMEVHLYEFWDYGATKGGTVQKENLELAGNKTWAICVPNFCYPKESVNISTTDGNCAYPLFLKWAQNRTPENEDWHLHPNEKNVYR